MDALFFFFFFLAGLKFLKGRNIVIGVRPFLYYLHLRPPLSPLPARPMLQRLDIIVRCRAAGSLSDEVGFFLSFSLIILPMSRRDEGLILAARMCKQNCRNKAAVELWGKGIGRVS